MSVADRTAMPRISAQARQLHGTRKNRFTVATFRSWRGSPPSVAWNPAVNTSIRGSSRPLGGLDREFNPAAAGCRSGRLAPVVRAPLPPRLARPKKTGAYDRARTDDLRFTKPLLYQLSYVGKTLVFTGFFLTIYRSAISTTSSRAFKCSGRQIKRSLKTSDKEPAKRRLESLRQKVSKLNTKASGVLFKGLAARWLEAAGGTMKPQSRREKFRNGFRTDRRRRRYGSFGRYFPTRCHGKDTGT